MIFLIKKIICALFDKHYYLLKFNEFTGRYQPSRTDKCIFCKKYRYESKNYLGF